MRPPHDDLERLTRSASGLLDAVERARPDWFMKLDAGDRDRLCDAVRDLSYELVRVRSGHPVGWVRSGA
jgi:hypothetical protein